MATRSAFAYTINMDNENFTLLLVLFLAQNKELMREIEPALSFVEEHKDSLALFKEMLEKQTTDSRSAKMPATDKPTESTQSTESTSPTGSTEPTEPKEKRSPLQGIASDEILQEIRSYLSAQSKAQNKA